MPQQLPTCKNPQCARYRSTQEVVVLNEDANSVTFGCKCCLGIQVRTLSWKRATQENDYRTKGRPEYARIRRHFFQGKNQHIGG